MHVGCLHLLEELVYQQPLYLHSCILPAYEHVCIYIWQYSDGGKVKSHHAAMLPLSLIITICHRLGCKAGIASGCHTFQQATAHRQSAITLIKGTSSCTAIFRR